MEKYLDKNSVLRLLQGIKTQIDKSKESVLDTKGIANGIASLDDNGNVPLYQLGNVDTVLFEIVHVLPTELTEQQKNHIFIVPRGLESESDQNAYKEYIYTGEDLGNIAPYYWEELGEFTLEADLKPYSKKSETTSPSSFRFKRINEAGELALLYTDATGKEFQVKVPRVNSGNENDGLITAPDKFKLDYIENGATRTIVDDSLSASSTNPVQNKIISEALNKKANTDVATTSTNGLMSNDDKAKIDYIFGIDNYAKKILTTNFVNAIQFCHCDNSAWTTTNDYDVIVGNRPDGTAISNDFAQDGFIKIDSTKSADSDGVFKQGHMYITIPNDTGSINLGRGVSETKASAITLSETGNINITQNNKPSTSNIQLNGTNIQLTQSNDKANAVLGRYAGTNVNINEYQFSINNRKNGQEEKYFYIDHSGDLTNLPNKDADKIQFFAGDLGVQSIPLQIKKDEIKCWGDQISSTKGKDIRLKTSSNNSVRLTEGEGFKVFANLFAEPDHATDITEFTNEEKAMLKNNSVQRLLIMILRKLNLIDVIDPNT